MKIQLCLAALLLAAIPAMAQPGATGGTPLDRPAQVSRLAAHGALLDVAAAGRRLVAVGERGHVLLSDDGGQAWRQSAVPVSVTLTAVHFVDEHSGWAVGHGGVVLSTRDGGAGWARQTDGRALVPALSEALRAAEAANDPGLADKLRRFIDEGADKPLLDIFFLDERRGFATGAYGLLLATDDGGAHWRVACNRLDSEEDRHIYTVRQMGDTLWLAGEQGLLYRSTDDGNSFERMESPAESTWFGLAGSGGELLLLGLRGALWHSPDDGAHWRRVELDTKYSFVAGLTLGAGKGHLLADDGGGLWHFPRGAALPRRLENSARFPLAGLAPAGDGGVVASGLLGTLRIPTSGL